MQTESFDLVILDVMLPGRSGLEILQTMRRHGLRTPVLMLTARDAVEDRVRGLDTGADDYLVKPFAFPELLARVRALSRRATAGKQPEAANRRSRTGRGRPLRYASRPVAGPDRARIRAAGIPGAPPGPRRVARDADARRLERSRPPHAARQRDRRARCPFAPQGGRSVRRRSWFIPCAASASWFAKSKTNARATYR